MKIAGKRHSYDKHFTLDFILCFARMERDSSNDANMFEDSSGEESEATCGLSDGVPSVSNSKNSKTDKVDSETPLPIDAANSTAVVSLQKSSAALDEECLVPISEEEQDFFERYRDGNLSLIKCLPLQGCLISCIFFSSFQQTKLS